MKTLKLVLLLSIVVTNLCSQPIRILWLGNSYTAYNNLPTMFSNLAASAGYTVIVDSNTPGGFTFQQHAGNATSLQKINAGNWDYVVLQAQSQEPAFPPSQVEQQTIPPALQLHSFIKEASPCAEVVFYMTWGRKFGDTQNCAAYPPICTFEGMTNRLKESYLLMADLTESMVSPVGISWQNARQENEIPDLWVSDNSHPSLAGSYLSACTFFASIFRESPIGLSFHGGLSSTEASFLQGIAHETVMDSLAQWRIGIYDPKAEFSYSLNGLEVNFEQSALNAETYSWDFGDGAQSGLQNPVHVFASEGDYEVSLIVSDGCKSDTIIKQVNIELPAQIKHSQKGYNSFFAYPNPVNAGERIHHSDSLIRVLDISGREYKGISQEGLNYIIIPSSGIYLLQFEGGIYTRIIVK